MRRFGELRTVGRFAAADGAAVAAVSVNIEV
jgi:hypothetical protein